MDAAMMETADPSNKSMVLHGLGALPRATKASIRETCHDHDVHNEGNTNGYVSDLGKNDRDLLEPIAVVGLSCKFPEDATCPELFWKMVLDKKCASKDYPPDRMNIDAFYHPDASKLNTVHLPFVKPPTIRSADG